MPFCEYDAVELQLLEESTDALSEATVSFFFFLFLIMVLDAGWWQSVAPLMEVPAGSPAAPPSGNVEWR